MVNLRYPISLAVFVSTLSIADFSHAQICHADGLRNCLYYTPDFDDLTNVSIKLAPPNRPELSNFYFFYDSKSGIIRNEAGYCIKYNPINFRSSDNQFSLVADRTCQSVNTTTWTFQDQARGIDYATLRPYKKIDDNENILYEVYERRPKLCLTVKPRDQQTEITLINCVNDYAFLPMRPDPSQRFFAMARRMGTQPPPLTDIEVKSTLIPPWHAP